MITLNGKESKTYANLNELLEENEFRRELIAVEINGEIIKKSDYDTTPINDGDIVEVVHFMGGGAFA
ncbi:MAG: sulfur carrier protein ThiS [Clostridia bacterium]|nr:sulfur carrier protein ThiS [Clostridia bacterium]